MKSFIKIYFDRWYVPVSLAVILGVIGTTTVVSPYPIVVQISQGIPSVAFMLSLLVGMSRVYRKEFKTGVLQVILTFISGLFFIMIFTVFTQFNPHNFKNVYIPEDLAFSLPADPAERGQIQSEETMILYSGETSNDFQLDVWYGEIESGQVYLRAYEVTSKIPLTLGSLKDKSRIDVRNPGSELMRFGTDNSFQIMEGFPGKPYAARLELWFQPDNGSQEVKLMEKIYKIEK